MGLNGVPRLGRVLVLALASLLLLPVSAGAAAPAQPVNVVAPTISGEATHRERLVAHPGSWAPDGLTHAYQWFRDDRAVAGATGRRYRLGLDDIRHRLHVVVTATGDGGKTSAASESTPRVGKAELDNEQRPRISGSRRFTRTLTADPGTWERRPAKVRYRWLRSGEPIAGATSRRYRLAAADVGKPIRVRVVVRREGFTRAQASSRATARIRHRVPARRTVNYHVETRGRITTSLADFKRLAQQTYDDPRGWRNAGIRFRRVATGGSLTLVLSEASWLPRFSSGCSSSWSCRVGRFVIINQERWKHASPAWNARGGSLRDYRHMVVGHETGHWLGHGHRGCPGPGSLAPVMMQQSIELDGCRFNPWPIRSELWSG